MDASKKKSKVKYLMGKYSSMNVNLNDSPGNSLKDVGEGSQSPHSKSPD